MTHYLQTLSIFVLLLSSTLCADAQTTITGADALCAEACETYEVLDGDGGPYFWISTGNIIGENNGQTVKVCWDIIGSNELQVLDFAAAFGQQSTVVDIDIHANPNPEIISPLYPDCIVRDSLGSGNPNGDEEIKTLDCKTVCSGSIATYSALGNNGSTFSWSVESGTIVSQTSGDVTIQWDTDGSGTITLTESNMGCSTTIEQCMEILPPTSVDIVALNGGPTSLDVCLGQTVYLQGIGSESVTNYEWMFGDGTTASGGSTNITYNTPGSYIVTMVGSTECGCFEMTDYLINVDSNPGPKIECTGTICAGDEATYYADQTCTSYSWSLSSNGSVIDGGSATDNYISVLWSAGAVGTVTLSTSGCNTPACAQATTVEIPIIDNTATISGPTVACKDGYGTYRIQNYNGADYYWSLTGNGTIIDGYNTNEITIQWDDSPWSGNQAIIEVSYDNCQLNCGGQASLTVDMLPDFKLDVQPKYCSTTDTRIYVLEGWNSATVDIEIITPSGVGTPFSSVNSIVQNFSEIGKYKVIATDNAGLYCNSQITAAFEIVAPPTAPDTIYGPKAICLNETYIYSIPAIPGQYARWIIKDGTSTDYQTAESVAITWISSGQKTITAEYRIDDIGCPSDNITIQIEEAQNAAITGPSSVCLGELTTFSSGISKATDIDWTIVPADAGSVKINDDNSVDITWHQVGTHTINSTFCTEALSYNVEVFSNPSVLATFPEKVCSGDNATISLATTLDVMLLTEDDQIVANGSLHVVAPGKYKAIVTSANGCEEIIPIVIDTFLPPSVRVSSPDENLFCQPHVGVTITALATDGGYAYEWYHNGINMGITDPSFTTSNFGEYYAIVTDQNGCSAQSNIHTLYDDCGPPPPPGQCSGAGNSGVLTFGGINFACNGIEFNVKGTTFTSTAFSWIFGDPDSGADNFATGPTASHLFTSAGYYYVYVAGDMGGEDAVDIFTVPAAPRFDYDQACAGSAVQFNNHSTFIPTYTITDYRWDFGDPASGADNTSTDKEPTHTYTASGTYLASLEIETNTGCTSTYTLAVEVLEGPPVAFVAPNSTCADRGLQFVGLQSDEIITYSWDFDDPASGAANTAETQTVIHEFSSSGSYDVSLTVANIDGCESTLVETISITTSSLSGDVVSDISFPMCFGQTATLTAPAAGIHYLWSTGETTQDISVADAGVYTVQIDDGSGCAFTPDPIVVTVIGVFSNKITGTHYPDPDSYFGDAYFDSLTICEGDRLDLRTRYLFNGVYTWTLGTSTSYFVSTTELGTLSAGTHNVVATIEDTNTGCIVDTEPFKIKVEALPAQPEINATSTQLCAGTPHLLSVNNPDPQVRYFWSTGAEATNITASNAGYYFVTAVNRNGCERESNGVWINGLPDANRINIGCTSTCFPDTLCTPSIANATQYQWLFEGSPINSTIGSDLIVNQAGDYQLIVQNWNGCADTSDILSIEAEPSDQSLSGLIFIDDNGNDIWDAGEELLSGIDVHIWENNTIAGTTQTDANGYYIFDPINITNPEITIDTLGLNLNLTGGSMSESVNFLTCVEDKMQDFPLIRDCSSITEASTEMVCPGSSILVEGVELWAGDVYPFDAQTAAGCDSTHVVTVMAFPDSDVQITPTGTCPGESSGILEIIIMTGTGLQFALDNPSSFTTNLLFENLTAGAHTLWLIDDNGCTKPYDFNIDVAAAPSAPLLTTDACAGMSNGSVIIDNSAALGSTFSLDGVNFTTATTYDNLQMGSYTMYIAGADGNCVFEAPFDIQESLGLDLDVEIQAPCAGTSEGSIQVITTIAQSVEYSIDGLLFGSSPNFTGLPTGTYTIYVRESNGCISTIMTTVAEEPEPTVSYTAEPSCANMDNGIFVGQTGFSYSIDNIDFSTDTIITALAPGFHTIYAIGPDGCEHDFDIEVLESDPLDVTFDDPITDCSVTEVVLAPMISQSTGDVSFLWDDGVTAASRSAEESGTYEVIVSDKCDSRSYTYDISIEEITAVQPIYFPNIFSPDDNGINDCFVPTLAQETQVLSYTLVIFDRWGNRLFETEDMNDCWDGTFNGSKVRGGVFVYLVEMQYTYCVEVESITKYGDVTVLD